MNCSGGRTAILGNFLMVLFCFLKVIVTKFLSTLYQIGKSFAHQLSTLHSQNVHASNSDSLKQKEQSF